MGSYLFVFLLITVGLWVSGASLKDAADFFQAYCDLNPGHCGEDIEEAVDKGEQILFDILCNRFPERCKGDAEPEIEPEDEEVIFKDYCEKYPERCGKDVKAAIEKGKEVVQEIYSLSSPEDCDKRAKTARRQNHLFENLLRLLTEKHYSG